MARPLDRPGEIVVIPKEASLELEKGDEVEVCRTEQGFEVTSDNGFER